MLPQVKPGDPAEQALQACLELALLRIQSTEAEAMRGEHEGIHLLRTTTRRLRSELRAFRVMAETNWIEDLERELKWFAGTLGKVRDIDVLTMRLKKALSRSEDANVSTMSALFTDLSERHASGLRAVRDALQSERWSELMAALQEAIEHPGLKKEACLPCRVALPPLAALAWRRLKKAARDLHPSDPDEKFHDVRKLAKRARYVAEMIAPTLGHARSRIARSYIRRTIRVQDALGEHQDAINAAREIAEVIATHQDDEDFSRDGSRLIEMQHEAAQEARSDFFRAWHKLDRKKWRRWMKVPSKCKT